MENKDLQQVDKSIIKDEFAYNGPQYVVLETNHSEEIKDLLVIMKAERQEDGSYALLSVGEEEYKEAAKFYMELLDSIN